MNRRNFLINASLAIAGLAIDPEELFWTPRRDRIFVPSADEFTYFFNPYQFTIFFKRDKIFIVDSLGDVHSTHFYNI